MTALFTVFAFLFIQGSAFATPNNSGVEHAKSRLEELFLWKVSEGLSLKTQEEEHFRGEFKKLSQKRYKISEQIDETLDSMDKAANRKKVTNLLDRYRTQLKNYNDVQIEEVRVMRRIFGEKRMAQYLIMKRDLTQKLKNMLSNPSRPGSSAPKE